MNDLYAEPKREEIVGSSIVPCMGSEPKQAASKKLKKFQSKI